MTAKIKKVTRGLTLRYLFALGVVGMLAYANYRLLQVEMQASESSVAFLTLSGRQRTLLQSTALLAEALVGVFDDSDRRAALLRELRESTEMLERAHYRLVEFDPTGSGGPPPEVQEIYESSPWLLDTEMRNYLIQLRELARSDEDDLNYFNPHYRYIQQVALKGEVMDGLEEVVSVYRSKSEEQAAQLRWMAQFSLLSTVVVLALSGMLVFRPMVQLVRRDMALLNRLNETLELRVAERTAVAEQRARDLAASEALYQSLVETLPLGVARTDGQGRFTYVNRVFCQIVGRNRDAIIGSLWGQVLSSQYAELSTPGEANLGPQAQAVQRWQRNTADSDPSQLLESVETPVSSSSGQTVGNQILIWDITERQAAEERMLRAERLAAIGEMMAGVAHESRNALQQINACAKMLEWEFDANQEASGLIVDIHKAHARLHRLFENLRGYVSPLQIDVRPVLLADVFQEAWKSTAAIRRERKVDLQVQGVPDQTWCRVDPFQLEQVFRNVLENSLLACSDPTRITVDWGLVQRDGQWQVRISIIDNGPGLSTEVQAKIFDAFFTTRTRGTGLGMAIVRRIIEAHHGEIQAGPAPRGSGTEICIYLPKGDSCTENSPSPLPMTNRECESFFASP